VNIFFNFHGIFIVFGGTLAVSLICFNFRFLYNSILILIKKIIGESKKNIIRTIDEITDLSKSMQEGATLDSQLTNLQNPFLKECCEIMGQGILTSDELRDVMDKRLEIQNENYKREGLTYRVLGKFPPAFGLIGTSIGMIVLLQGLGSADAFEKIGPRVY
jgi:chemotaxis protein MotA